ncbi:hypothetical protein BRADI_1g55166v3 [Brachypodium distachyon]|uniref:Uncharacterized protein n=1 Tax=Brachypodium distachyon TaxID=15368 RepID=A0A2K2DRH6_BRADI|nr:hypothetical protein BRADI_1g55166v3 [Brachypodium distachyon]
MAAAAVILLLFVLVFSGGSSVAAARPVVTRKLKHGAGVVRVSWTEMSESSASAQASGCTNGSGVGGGICHPPAGH